MYYQCTACPSICRRDFATAAAWRSHEMRCMMHSRAPMYVCEIDPRNCSLGFSFTSSYIDHLGAAHQLSVVDPKRLDAIRIGEYCDRFYCGFCRRVYPIYVHTHYDPWLASRLHHIQGHFEGLYGEPRHVREWFEPLNYDWNGWPIPVWLQARQIPNLSMGSRQGIEEPVIGNHLTIPIQALLEEPLEDPSAAAPPAR